MPSGAMTHFGFAQETTAGTLATISKFIDPTSADLDDSYPREAIATMREDRSRVRSIRKLVEAKGNFTSPAYFNALPWFFKFGLGPATTVTAGVGGYTHTFEGLGATLDTFSAEIGYSTAGAKQMAGCVVDKLALSGKAGEAAEVSIDFLGTRTYTNAAAVVAGLPADDNIASFEMATVKFDAVSNLEVISAELSIENNLEAIATLNGTYYPQRIAEGGRSITLALEMDFLDQDMYDLAVAGTQTAVELAFTSTVMAGGVGFPFKMVFDIPNVKFANVSSPVEADGIMSQKVDTVVLYDGTAGYDISIEVTNTDVSYPDPA